MRLALALFTLPLAACTANMAGHAMMSGPMGTCRPDALPSFVGQPATQELGARLLAASGARNIRWVAKGMMVTMDFSPERLTVYLDENNRVERASCG
ncbi:MAG: I78 family peptidase inhibitor [Pseudomonadota bacterium]|nr:I78 family peptidase inhibitor [Pseudomonadota bacterium]